MRWLADERLHGSIVASLRTYGHDVVYAAETLRKTPGLTLAETATADHRLVITEDRDFGRIVFQNKQTVPGIVYLRLRLEDRKLQWPRLKHLIDQHGERLYGQYVVIDHRHFRSRLLAEL